MHYRMQPSTLQQPALMLSVTMQNISNKITATKKVMLRAINLFLLGLLLQGRLLLLHCIVISLDLMQTNCCNFLQLNSKFFPLYFMLTLYCTVVIYAWCGKSKLAVYFSSGMCSYFLGGYFHGRKHLSYGVDVGKIRWLGVLQVLSWSFQSSTIMVNESRSLYHFLPCF